MKITHYKSKMIGNKSEIDQCSVAAISTNTVRMGVASVPLVPDSVTVVVATVVTLASTMSGEVTAAIANSNTWGSVTTVGSSEFTDSAISCRHQIKGVSH